MNPKGPELKQNLHKTYLNAEERHLMETAKGQLKLIQNNVHSGQDYSFLADNAINHTIPELKDILSRNPNLQPELMDAIRSLIAGLDDAIPDSYESSRQTR
ncbi:MAG: hypothetical protein M1383_02850 [Patescibacteria group bacterium]|nr:hypothetical protein [Patescibacteria group bacterium]